MKKYVIEREIPGIGTTSMQEMREAAQTSNAALAKLAPKVQWQHSYVVGDKTYCVYLAESEEMVREHARISGFPATVVSEVRRVIDPTTEAWRRAAG
jgi:hypothetical protein